MKAIAAHFRYISKNGRLDIEDEQGRVSSGSDALRELGEDWQTGGTRIDDLGHRREAFNVMLSMPRGTADATIVQRAAREFARAEFAGHAYVMVLHDHQANPHVHLSVRAEGRDGRRLNPRKADLQRWRETFAENLRAIGIDAEATRRVSRSGVRYPEPLWRIKAREEGRLRAYGARSRSAPSSMRGAALQAWDEIQKALRESPDVADRELAVAVARVLDPPGERSGRGVERRPGQESPERSEKAVAPRGPETMKSMNEKPIDRGPR